ncbi:class I adenylate-forming enzyme family protein [Wenjunlia tyrosinilytica]|uniref:Cyclohexanecarboxylate-CoA ligase n=1 Tax=Wenjunlia tyrosinilytica TaxID=1544741 RepID=A0A918DW05_9ACTN|nr:AMP-binding protein [Wenjunlia tyrosinilytica]GGO86846.1 cyclohexanecarboxylate-CoA ligase [Wenjunlia tyrosinilytica]
MDTGSPAGARTLWELVARRAALSPDAPMLLDERDRRLTFGGFAAAAERVAAGLHGLGVGAGSRVTWQLPTRVETVVVSAALARLGAVQNPVIPVHRDREVGFALRQTDAEFYLSPGDWRGFDFTAMARRLEAPRVLEAYTALPEGDPSSLPPPPEAAEGGQVRWIYYTSGTTSDPKGVLHTDRSLIAGGTCLASALGLGADDIGSIAFPYAHIGGPDYLVTLLLHGFPSLLIERFALPDALDAYRRHGVTTAGGSTAFYSAFLAEQRKLPEGTRLLPSLRLLAGGGAPKPPELYHEVVHELGCALAHGYGMTEAPMITMGSPHDTVEQLAHTEGRPPAAMEIRIVDGEIRLRGPAVCQGYTDPALTAEAFDDEGFFRTGDLGHLRPDGHLVLTGRLKDVIIRKGENISAKEIEELLYRHARIGDAAVIGLPDPARGERVCAVVEQPEGAPALTLAEIVEYLEGAGLMRQKIPEQLEIVEALPRNETLRKVLKHKLRERFAGRPWP